MSHMTVGRSNKCLKEKDKITKEFKVGLIHSLKTVVGHLKTPKFKHKLSVFRAYNKLLKTNIFTDV